MSEKLEVRHQDLLKTINSLKKQGDGRHLVFPPNYYKATFTNKMGREFEMYELNKTAFMKIIMQLGRYKNISILQDEFIEGFQQMEQALLNHQNNEWVLTREQGKAVRLEMTDKVKDFIEYAKEQGASKGADFYYRNLTKATYKALKVLQYEKPKTRAMLDKMELHQLIVAENSLQILIAHEMKKDTHYKEIYLLCKLKLEAIANSFCLTLTL